MRIFRCEEQGFPASLLLIKYIYVLYFPFQPLIFRRLIYMLRLVAMQLLDYLPKATATVGKSACRAALPRLGLDGKYHHKLLSTVSSLFPAAAPSLPCRTGFSTTPRAYQQRYTSASESLERPVSIEEVDFDPALSNAVTVMGNVGQKPDVRYFENGNKVASWSIAYKARREGDTEWFDVEAWGPLAEAVARDVERGQRLVVQGKLRVAKWTDAQGQQRTKYRIVANAIKKVRSMLSATSAPASEAWQQTGSQPSASPQEPVQYSPPETQTPPSPQPMATTEELWMSFFEDTSGWYDNRPRKAAGEINQRAPDFKRKEGGRDAPALWIDSRSTPGWVRSELSRLDGISGEAPPF
jgi:single-strand DNA-binding protein